MIPKVWLYWDSPGEGRDPGYISLCRETIVKWARPYDVIVLDKSTASQWVEGLHPEFGDIPVIAHRADYVRAACLAENGGIWLDIDTVVLKPLSLIWALTSVNGAVFYGWKPRQPSIGMIAAVPRHPILIAWREAIERQIDKSLSQRWAGFGYDLLWPIAEHGGFTQLPREACAPTHWTETGLFSSRRSASEFVSDETLMVQLYNRGLSAKMGEMAATDIVEGCSLLSSFFKMSRDDSIDLRSAAVAAACASISVNTMRSLEPDFCPARWVDGRALINAVVGSYNALSRAEGSWGIGGDL